MLLRARIAVVPKDQKITCDDCDKQIPVGERYILYEEVGPDWTNPAKLHFACAANSQNDIWLTE